MRLAGRTVTGTLLFVLGFAAVFTSCGAAFGAAGAVLITHYEAITRVLGGFTIALGSLQLVDLRLQPGELGLWLGSSSTSSRPSRSDRRAKPGHTAIRTSFLHRLLDDLL